MFHTNDTICYGTEGVCVITDVRELALSGAAEPYYVLHPVRQQSATVFVPLGNPALVAKMQRLPTRQEILQAVRSSPEALDWDRSETERKAHYREVFTGGNRRALIRLVKALYLRRRTAKLPVSDGRFLKEAERLLCDELSYVLHLDPEQALSFLQSAD